LVYAGVDDILIVTSQSKKALEDYFDKNYELEQKLQAEGKQDLLEAINIPKNLANFAFVKQKEALGT
jgi:UTP--glucose-1-phosphate uridylyltransferase